MYKLLTTRHLLNNLYNILSKQNYQVSSFFSNQNLSKSNFEINIKPKLTNNSGGEFDFAPYVSKENLWGNGKKVFIEVYGCQMNNNDSEIVYSILKLWGYSIADSIDKCDIALLMTCAIRDKAEVKIWKRLEYLKQLKRFKEKSNKIAIPLKVGLLGCMAERLKMQILEKENSIVDLICGPDAYRSLPVLLCQALEGNTAANVQLSIDETYADIQPVRTNPNSTTAFVSIMRGCNNLCSYCIVPFTRGRERSRPMDSIIEEIKILSEKGIKEITLLGQNVNSYCDTSTLTSYNDFQENLQIQKVLPIRPGFKSTCKPSLKIGWNFVDLLDRVSKINSEMRIRFTSPHPKDYPDQIFDLIKERPNICRQLHIPAQSGSNKVLERMNRGYTQELYLELIYKAREVLPGVSISSDFISGFCGETEKDHKLTVDLLRKVKYNIAYCFLYSMREKTKAHRNLIDDVPPEIKRQRHQELIQVFREEAELLNKSLIGSNQLILVEGFSKRTDKDMYGRMDNNIKVIFPRMTPLKYDNESLISKDTNIGDYIVTKITAANSQVLIGTPLYHTSIENFIPVI